MPYIELTWQQKCCSVCEKFKGLNKYLSLFYIFHFDLSIELIEVITV